MEFRGEVEIIDSWSAYRQPCRVIEDPVIVNTFAALGGSQKVPVPGNIATEVSDEHVAASLPYSYYDSVMGPVSQAKFAASAGSTTVNRISLAVFSGSAVAGRVQGAKLFVRALSGSGLFKLYSPRGQNNLVNCDFAITTEWQCVSAGGTIGTITSNDTNVYIYPNDSAGLTLLYTELVSWDVARPHDCGAYLRGHMPPRGMNAVPTTITASRVLTAADFAGQSVLLNASTMDLDVPSDAAVPVPVGTRLRVWNIHANTATVTAGSGATFAQSSVNIPANTEIELFKSAANTWIAFT